MAGGDNARGDAISGGGGEDSVDLASVVPARATTPPPPPAPSLPLNLNQFTRSRAENSVYAVGPPVDTVNYSSKLALTAPAGVSSDREKKS